MTGRISMGLLLLAIASACTTDDGIREELRALANAEASCTTAAECCVVVDGCMATAYVVGAGDWAEARDLVSRLDDEPCVACIPPAVRLLCVEGRCVGEEVDPSNDEETSWYGDRCGEASVDGAPDDEAPIDEAPAADEAGEQGRMLGCGAE